MSFSYSWEDDNRAEVQAKVKAALRRGLRLAGEHILGVSNKQVPFEEGYLALTGAVTEDPGSMTVAISYDTPYAVIQHEDLSLRHDQGRNAKYLENACRSEKATAGKIIANAVKAEVGN